MLFTVRSLKKPTMHITKNSNRFHCTLLTMHGANDTAIRVNAANKSILNLRSLSVYSNNEEVTPGRPHALRGHVTDASWNLALMPEIDRTYLTPEI